ncbi:MAG: FliM/FliN family flagellar motor switch protein [Rhodobacteraceae bacterium]|nr:FliM/FliN family flagellar motor switch protein [Paracoccaceae bacterium]
MAARRKLAVQADVSALEAAFRVAFGRMARDLPGFSATASAAALRPASLAEIVDLAEPGMFLAMLDGQQEQLGLAMLCPTLMGALLEVTTTGQLWEDDVAPETPRKPTPTDAVLIAPVVDALLGQIAARLEGRAECDLFAGFGYGSFLDDPRPLGLVLEDIPYRLAQFDIAIGAAGRQGQCWLFLPERAPAAKHAQGHDSSEPAPNWSERLEAAVHDSAVQLDAVLYRVRISLSELGQLSQGDVLCLPDSALEALRLETLDGQVLARARLGQTHGHRAVRMTSAPGSAEHPADASPPVVPARILPASGQQPRAQPPRSGRVSLPPSGQAASGLADQSVIGPDATDAPAPPTDAAAD